MQLSSIANQININVASKFRWCSVSHFSIVDQSRPQFRESLALIMQSILWTFKTLFSCSSVQETSAGCSGTALLAQYWSTLLHCHVDHGATAFCKGARWTESNEKFALRQQTEPDRTKCIWRIDLHFTCTLQKLGFYCSYGNTNSNECEFSVCHSQHYGLTRRM